ncbi:phage N-6-adenine-methyltransferase [Fructobacillus americanaquae]|uniref:Phage N-6-adenine-methyltransferase n=1 Tax=Fructobacillus americanaquae TaxID=2940302 RepID=A0ABY5BZS7_9LACO|nr:phage N-6-adenine-methyltransferase [Fructobacillus americanaquae]USS92016.1 phage N-6-adenine-methyltransferase [Fructobacillus americanaquae]
MDKVLFSSKKDDWETPTDLFDDLNKKFKFDLDACADDSNHKLSNYYSESNSCLERDWHGNVFMNPPYGRSIYQFIQKAYEEHLRDENRFIVMLIPSRTDTKYWHDFIQDKAVVKFIRGRLKFEVDGVPRDAAPFPSCLVVYGF